MILLSVWNDSNHLSSSLSFIRFWLVSCCGPFILLVETVDRAAGYTTRPNGTGIASVYESDITGRVFYLRSGNAAIVQLPFDEKTATIRKFELKRLLHSLPDSFTTSNERVEFSTFIKLLHSYNADVAKKS